MDLFKTLNHREILNDLIENKKKQGKRLSFSSLADAVGVQKTYVSRVMAGDACWNADQVFVLSQEFELTDDQAEYFALLVEIERSGLEKRRQALQTRVKEIRRRNLRSQKTLAAETLDVNAPAMAEYFADPYHSLVHVYFSIAKYRKGMTRLAQTLGIASAHLMQIVRRLQDLGVVRYNEKLDQVELLKPSVQTPADSQLVHAHQTLFRAMSIDRLVRCPINRKNTYSAVFSGDVSLQETLWAEFLQYLKKVEKAAHEDRNESEVFYLQFDLFPWAGGHG